MASLPGTPGQRISDLCNGNQDMLAGQIGQLAPMDEEAANLFRQLMKKMMEQTGMETDENRIHNNCEPL